MWKLVNKLHCREVRELQQGHMSTGQNMVQDQFGTQVETASIVTIW